ncbi:MAG: hypothetical protein EBR86_13070 [Planctomycetia bacterium]|nr:hypothetical protein [Planctomycetia bacterium]
MAAAVIQPRVFRLDMQGLELEVEGREGHPGHEKAAGGEKAAAEQMMQRIEKVERMLAERLEAQQRSVEKGVRGMAEDMQQALGERFQEVRRAMEETRERLEDSRRRMAEMEERMSRMEKAVQGQKPHGK